MELLIKALKQEQREIEQAELAFNIAKGIHGTIIDTMFGSLKECCDHKDPDIDVCKHKDLVSTCHPFPIDGHPVYDECLIKNCPLLMEEVMLDEALCSSSTD